METGKSKHSNPIEKIGPHRRPIGQREVDSTAARNWDKNAGPGRILIGFFGRDSFSDEEWVFERIMVKVSKEKSRRKRTRGW